MALGTEVGLGPGHTVLDRDPAPPSPKKGHSQFSSGWIKMALGMEVGLGPDHIVLD